MRTIFFLAFLLTTSSIKSVCFAQNISVTAPIGFSGFVGEIKLHPIKNVLATISKQQIKLWDFESGRLLRSFTEDAEFINDFVMADEYLFTANSEGLANLWSIESGAIVRTFRGHNESLSSLDVSADGRYLITSSYDETAKIWDVATGRLLHTLSGHSSWVTDANFNKDSKLAITSSYDNSAKIWDVATGKLLKTLIGHKKPIKSAEFSGNGLFALTVAEEEGIKVWDVVTGKMLNNVDDIFFAQFSPDDKFLVTKSKVGETKICELSTGKVIKDLSKEFGRMASFNFSKSGRYFLSENDKGKIRIFKTSDWSLVNSISSASNYFPLHAQFTNDEKFILANTRENITVVDVHNGNTVRTFSRWTEGINSASFDAVGNSIFASSYSWPDKKWRLEDGNVSFINTTFPKDLAYNFQKYSPKQRYVATSTLNTTTVSLWDTETGKLISNLEGHSYFPTQAVFSSDEKYLLTGSSGDFATKLWDTKTGKLLANLVSGPAMKPPVFSRQGGLIATLGVSRATNTKIWKGSTGELVNILIGENHVSAAKFSEDEKFIATASVDGTAKVWECKTGKLLRSISVSNDMLVDIDFSKDGRYIVTSSNDKTAKIWMAATGALVHTLKGHTQELKFSRFSPNGDYVITNSFDNTAKLWNTNSGELVLDITKHTDRIVSVEFSSDGKYLITASKDSKLILWDVKNRKELLSVINFDNEWVVTNPSGLFDASPGAMSDLYFVQGMETIDLSQLKHRYYEPELWRKVIANEPLREVANMNTIELPPEVQVSNVDEKGFLSIKLTNKGGGIGKVAVLINGKETIADARPKDFDSKTKNLSIKYFIGNNKALIKGSENFIAVKAWNERQWVVSRGAIITYKLDGNENNYKPAIHIITSGVSDYAGTELDLKYAAKDADEVSKALQLGARKLFGTDRSYIYNLTTSQTNNLSPTKANILKTFEKVSSSAHPLDLVVVYLSGHGINHGGKDGDWYYLTQEAYTSSSSAYNDPEVTRTSTISSNELVELFKKIPALKQVLMIDACASGKVVENLIAKKSIESNTLRALDRMRDRTGLHIITGCTADAVSYEASKYGQGVLTYSILEGIRGAALREDQFVDVNKLFQYAREKVPTLAEGIGGIQTPQVFSPMGGQSFDIGQLTEKEKRDIPIAHLRPVYIRSTFLDDDQLEDALQVGKKVDEALNEMASKGYGASINFVDVREYPEGCKLSGRYKQEHGMIKLRLRKKCGDKDETSEISGKTLEDLIDIIISVL